MFSRTNQTVAAGAAALMIAAGASGAALWGPVTGAEAVNPTLGSVQVLGKEFRWSPMMAPDIQFDTTFNAAYKRKGREAVGAAFDTWAAGVAGAGRDGILPVPAGKFDLESVAMHEIGHAIGLTHGDVSSALPDGMGGFVNRNYVVNAVAPFLGPLTAAAAGTEVMNSTIGATVRKRDLTMDDLHGMKYLYDAGNINAAVAPEPAAMAGPGNVVFGTRGVDSAGGMNKALLGTGVGQNIDIFAFDFTLVPPPPEGPRDIDNMPADAGGQEQIEIFRDPTGKVLAYTAIRFSYLPGTDGAGIIDGTPDAIFGDGVIVGGVDIVFNTKHEWFAPTPGSACLMAMSGCVCMSRRRR